MANFDATKSGPSANSYATTIEADDYLEFEYGSDEWSSLDDDAKERLLVSATRLIERLTAKYEKFDENQALNFPMDTNPDGYDLAKEACIIQAMHLYKNHEQIQEGIAGNIVGLKSESLGKTSKQITAFNPLAKYASSVVKLLSDYTITTLQCTR